MSDPLVKNIQESKVIFMTLDTSPYSCFARYSEKNWMVVTGTEDYESSDTELLEKLYQANKHLFEL